MVAGADLRLVYSGVSRHRLGGIYVNIFTCVIGYYGLPGIYTTCLTACLIQ
ncbi:hypothetical protein XBO1_2480017 [Xenorhabdus bovienii str. oregonense]|uniref:Uncharacterized protein n=1 Tax=Xenorhabdus bovienii str. oregonense TaxID=1398202 RepID=A0A077P6S6_XENBV|nr:hypothetical protein XBO1_2480017 [Xenorhabdus bovienii str. oregonense]